MKIKMKIYVTFLILIVYSIAGCDTFKPEAEIIADVIVDNTPDGNPVLIDNIVSQEFPSHVAQYQEDFDWENLEYLPAPSNTIPVPLPWNNKAKISFSDDIRYDIKKSDGWVLYLSGASTQVSMPVKTFLLYNKYRGIIRYYFLLSISKADSDKFSDYNILSQSIYTAGDHNPNSPLLNFAHQNIVDLNKNSTLCNTLEPQPMSDSIWYAWEYELAFDKEIYKQNPTSFRLNFGFGMLKKQILNINGHQLDKLNVKIRFSDANYSFGDYYLGNTNLVFYGQNDINQAKDILSIEDLSKINKVFNQQSFTNILNGTLSHNSLGEIQWNANIEILTQPNGVGLPGGSLSTVISGANNFDMVGLGTSYTKALGVFYLNSKPKITFSKLEKGSHQYEYALITNSVEYLFNPSVLEIADIKNIEQVLVATQNDGLTENYGSANLFMGQKLKSNVELTIQGVKVSFDVVPKDGGNPVHIVKTFQADIISAK